MFSSLGLFSKIVCPQGEQCQLISCIFTHTDIRKQPNLLDQPVGPGDVLAKAGSEPPRKKRKVSQLVPAVHEQVKKELGNIAKPKDESVFEAAGRPWTADRRVSPPPRQKQNGHNGSVQAEPAAQTADPTKASIKRKRESQPIKVESLNPRLLNKPPTAHNMRLRLLVLIHEQMVRLNKEVQATSDPSKGPLELSAQELIKEALNEEEYAAKSDPSVYANVMKLRIMALKRMGFDGWKAERLKQIARDHPELEAPSTPPSADIKTGLSLHEEIALLPSLVTPVDQLSRHGYVSISPTEAEIEQARQGVEASKGWEVCERCKTRFQVFPGRREEDGALTTGGRCHYHYGKARRPAKIKGEASHKEDLYTCCNQSLGTPGCTTSESHVFKVSETKRLALVTPFEKTPTKGEEIAKHAVCFDCEMGYTSLGMELIRLTATAWPSGEELLDVLVRPLGEILDLNSRFSGVWPEDYTKAVPHDGHQEQQMQGRAQVQDQLCMVDSPLRARELFFRYLTTTTPLIGHAIENDLNAVRIIHPMIIDTVILFPHPRGLPFRFGLKALVKKHLDKDIQMGGSRGHDSKEDARAAGDLVCFKLVSRWKTMLREGWTVDDGTFYPPPSANS